MSVWASSLLCEEEIDELKRSTSFSVTEIEALYERFKYLDKTNSGFLTFVEFQLIPEFYSNPFCNLILNHLEKLNSYEKVTFASYMEFLNIFNLKTPKSKRISFLFSFFDLDKKGKITRKNLIDIYTLMTTKNCDEKGKECSKRSEKEADNVLDLYDKGKKGYLNRTDFERLYNSDPSLEKNMIIDIRGFTGKFSDETDFIDMLWPSL